MFAYKQKKKLFKIKAPEGTEIEIRDTDIM